MGSWVSERKERDEQEGEENGEDHGEAVKGGVGGRGRGRTEVKLEVLSRFLACPPSFPKTQRDLVHVRSVNPITAVCMSIARFRKNVLSFFCSRTELSVGTSRALTP